MGLLVLEKKTFQGFYHIWAWRPCWSCDPSHLYKFSFLFSLNPSYEFLFQIAQLFLRTRNVFVKHYICPNHMPDHKGKWSFKGNNSELHHGIHSKVNQFIYTLVCNYVPNIRILANAVFQIFRSQGCSYPNACVLKTGVTEPKIYGICSNVN